MGKSSRLIIGVLLCFTLLVVWFAWSAFRSAPPLASENLRGAGLSISVAIEQLAAADPSFRSLARYTTPDIAYFALIDQQGIVRFHTNPRLVGQPFSNTDQKIFPDGISEQRERLGTGEEVYLLRTKIHPEHDEYLLVLSLHTYRADQVIRRARTGVTVISALTAALWGLTVTLLFMMRRDEHRRQEMQRRRELARLGELGAVMAHEIRNPLAGIKGFAQLIESAGDMEQARHYADRIVSQSLRMEVLVDDLLAFVREDTGEREPADLAMLVQECVTMIRMEADPERVEVVHIRQPEMHVKVVTVRIIQLLLNLLKNALQAMPDGGLLRVELENEIKSAIIRISDTGVGIPAENIPHIFEPFWTSKARGTGLGLALCQKVVQEHGGNLTVVSVAGSGTTFTLTLPLEV
ncbi:MAG: ATP-binding protein [Desulfuromonadaceae bacterium]|nr:ATP-binding protein [Desulfuromonadaceae bacterium]